MALISCPECGKEMSDRAKKCPQCACPIEYILSTINTEQGESVKRVVRKPAPIRIKPYQEEKYQKYEDFFTPPPTSKNGRKIRGIAGKFDQAFNYVKTEGVENIIDNAFRAIDDSGKELKDMSEERRERLFQKCQYSQQLLIDMRHAGWSKEITVFNRNWSVAYKGEAYFKEKFNDAFLETPFGKEIFSIRQCNPNEYKWELFPSDRLNRRMEKAEIYFDRSQAVVLSLVPYKKRETYKLSNYDWRIEVDLLNLNYDIYDANNRHIANVSTKWSSKTDIYVMDFWDEGLKKIFLAIAIAMDICKSSYEPRTLREKLDW